jgi:hypothetical protein
MVHRLSLNINFTKKEGAYRKADIWITARALFLECYQARMNGR